MSEKAPHSFGLSEHIGAISRRKFDEGVVLWPEAAGVLAAGLLVGLAEGVVRGVSSPLIGALRGQSH